jgi:1-acyl-sn-glycerol-3-phosphate acyltransferase
MLGWLSKFILFKLMGWKIEGKLPVHKKYLIVVAPHTSNWDFPIGVFFRRISPDFNPKYLAKKELFVFPFGYFFKWLGGYPVERSKHTNFVDSIVEAYDTNKDFVTTITPEGTRSYNPKWKTGFYYIAKKARIPILRVAMDYGQKRVVIDELYEVTKSVDETVIEFKKYFSQFKGRNEENGVKWPE